MNNRWIGIFAGICFSAAIGLAADSRAAGGQETPTAPESANLEADQMLRDASLQGRLDLMQQAVEKGAQVDAIDADGRTALMYAAFNGHTDCVRWLLDRKASVTARENLGRTALMFASTGPFAETVSLLLQRASDPNAVDEYENWTALMFAAGEGQLEVVQVLLKHGADPAAIDKDGDDAAYHAAQNRHATVAEVLRAAMQ